MDSIKIDKWTVETAQMKHAARKQSMSAVVQTFLRRAAAESGIDNYLDLIREVNSDADKYETLTEMERDFCDTASSAGMWAAVAGCVKPYIHLDEWLAFDDKTIEEISKAAMEINAHWFEQPGQEKKTDEPQPTSTPN
jgi:hypothetical protein